MKKNIIKAIIAASFVIGAIVSFNVEANANIKEEDKCKGGSCEFHDLQFNWYCISCCPEGKTPDCGPTGCTCF